MESDSLILLVASEDVQTGTLRRESLVVLAKRVIIEPEIHFLVMVLDVLVV